MFQGSCKANLRFNRLHLTQICETLFKMSLSDPVHFGYSVSFGHYLLGHDLWNVFSE